MDRQYRPVEMVLYHRQIDHDKSHQIAVVDHDRSEFSQELREKVLASGYFRLTGYGHSFDEAYRLLERDDADLILEIPDRFEAELTTVGVEKVFVVVNAINGVKGILGSSYVNTILSDFSHEKAALG